MRGQVAAPNEEVEGATVAPAKATPLVRFQLPKNDPLTCLPYRRHNVEAALLCFFKRLLLRFKPLVPEHQLDARVYEEAVVPIV